LLEETHKVLLYLAGWVKDIAKKSVLCEPGFDFLISFNSYNIFDSSGNFLLRLDPHTRKKILFCPSENT